MVEETVFFYLVILTKKFMGMRQMLKKTLRKRIWQAYFENRGAKV